MKKTRIIQIIREEIEKVVNETPIQEEDINEMATFYKTKGDKGAAKAALKRYFYECMMSGSAAKAAQNSKS